MPCNTLSIFKKRAAIVRHSLAGAALPALLAFAFLQPTSPLCAQTATGEMTLTVTDPTGSIIPGAKVDISGTDTGAAVRSIVTNNKGLADIPLLQPGRYTTAVTAPGFKTFIRAGVTVSVGNIINLEISLQLGESTETVTVTGETPLVEDKSETIAQVMQAKELLDLPLNGRNYLQAANLAPGVVPENAGRDNTFSAFGNSGLQNAFLLDGTRNVNYSRGLDNHARDMVRPPLDALQEFTVQTSNFSAEFGASAGGVVNAITKSGTNTLHGSAYDFLRNSSLDAINYFATSMPLLVQNQYGGSLGGPIVRDHAWLFGAYEGLHTRSESSAVATVPTALERIGNFSQTVNATNGKQVLIYDPSTTNGTGTAATRIQFAGNIIPSAAINSIGQTLVNLYPLPNSGTNLYRRNVPSKQDNQNGVIRADLQISTKDSVFARYSRQRATSSTESTLPSPASNPGEKVVDSSGVGVGYTRILSSTLVNEARFGYTDVQSNGAGTNPRNEIIPGSLDLAVTTGTPTFTVAAFAGIGSEAIANSPLRKSSAVWDWSDNLSKSLGKHNLKTGGEFMLIRPSTFAASNGRSAFKYSGVFTQNPSKRGTTGSALADLLLGDADSLNTGTVAQSVERGWFVGGYVADQWTTTPNLTLNLGLRYEYTAPYIETQNRMGNFILDPGSPLYGQLIFSGDSRLPRGLTSSDPHDLAPRVGLAYRVPNVKDLTIRSSFGLFYGQDEGTPITDRLVNNPPFYGYGGQTISSDQLHPSSGFVLSSTASIARPAPIPASSFVLAPAATSTLVSWPTHMRTSYVEQWSLSVQKQLPYGVLFEATYVGNHGVHLLARSPGNQPTVLNSTTVNSRRPLAQYTIAPVTAIGYWNMSNYSGLATKFEKRYSKGISFLSSITYGHALDLQNQGQDLCDTCGADDHIQNAYNHSEGYGNSDGDIRFRYVLSGILELPFGQGKPYLNSGIPAAIVGGWAISPIYQYQTGNHFTPSLSFDSANGGNSTFPNRLCNGNIGGGSIARYFDTSCFVVPPSYTFGNAGRNILVGPPNNQLDVSLQRRFRIERLHSSVLNLRLEGFNVLNHPQFGDPNAMVGNHLYGEISSAGAAREVQVAARLSF